MAQFFGTHQTRLDAKNRTSVPSGFRTILKNGNAAAPASMVLRPSHKHPCIEGWPIEAFEALSTPINQMDVFSEDHDDLAFAIFSGASQLDADKDGRIILPESLVEHAQLQDEIVFIGLGSIFHIWQPALAARRAEEAKERSRARRLTLPGRGAGA